MSRVLIIAVLLGSTLPAIAADPPAREPRDAAVDRALKFLQKSQEKDGAWQGGERGNPAVTSLCVMAFLSAGHAPGDGIYGETITKGIENVLQFKAGNPDLIATQGWSEMYHHGISTLMLAQALPRCKGKLAEDVKGKLETAVVAILKGQRKNDPKSIHFGGWRYKQNGTDSDISVSGWQVQALRAARSAGCEVPQESLSLATKYFRRRQDPNGGFHYNIVVPRVTVPCTADAMLALLESLDARPAVSCFMSVGAPVAPLAIFPALMESSSALDAVYNGLYRDVCKAGDYVQKNPPRWGDYHFFYGTYYGSLAMSRLGGNYWKTYQSKLYAVLLDNQRLDGSWLDSERVR